MIFEVGTNQNHFVQFISEQGTQLLGEAVGERHTPHLDARQQPELMRLAALTLVKVLGLVRPADRTDRRRPCR